MNPNVPQFEKYWRQKLLPEWAELDQWVQHGVDKGWVSYPYCSTHDGAPMTDEEERDFDDGGDPCLPALRLRDGSEPLRGGREHW